MKTLLSFGLLGAASALLRSAGKASAADVTLAELAKLKSASMGFSLELPYTVCHSPVTKEDCLAAALAISGQNAFKNNNYVDSMFSSSKPKGCSVKMHPTESDEWSNNQIYFNTNFDMAESKWQGNANAKKYSPVCGGGGNANYDALTAAKAKLTLSLDEPSATCVDRTEEDEVASHDDYYACWEYETGGSSKKGVIWNNEPWCADGKWTSFGMPWKNDDVTQNCCACGGGDRKATAVHTMVDTKTAMVDNNKAIELDIPSRENAASDALMHSPYFLVTYPHDEKHECVTRCVLSVPPPHPPAHRTPAARRWLSCHCYAALYPDPYVHSFLRFPRFSVILPSSTRRATRTRTVCASQPATVTETTRTRRFKSWRTVRFPQPANLTSNASTLAHSTISSNSKTVLPTTAKPDRRTRRSLPETS